MYLSEVVFLIFANHITLPIIFLIFANDISLPIILSKRGTQQCCLVQIGKAVWGFFLPTWCFPLSGRFYLFNFTPFQRWQWSDYLKSWDSFDMFYKSAMFTFTMILILTKPSGRVTNLFVLAVKRGDKKKVRNISWSNMTLMCERHQRIKHSEAIGRVLQLFLCLKHSGGQVCQGWLQYQGCHFLPAFSVACLCHFKIERWYSDCAIWSWMSLSYIRPANCLCLLWNRWCYSGEDVSELSGKVEDQLNPTFTSGSG